MKPSSQEEGQNCPMTAPAVHRSEPVAGRADAAVVACESPTAEDERPLDEILWRRFLKKLGEPPAAPRTDAEIWAELRLHGVAILRALLVTAAAAVLFRGAWPQVGELWNQGWLKLSWISGHEMVIFVLGLLLASVWMRWILGLGLIFWKFTIRHRGLPVLVLLAVMCLGWVETSVHPQLSSGYWLGYGILFALLLQAWREKSEEPPVHDDDLRRSRIAGRLAKHLQKNHATLKRIVLLGTWGSGKTQTLKLLRHELLKARPPQRFLTATVNPWRAQTAEEAMTIIASGFDEAIGGRRANARSWIRHPASAWFSSLTLEPGYGITMDLIRLIQGDAAGGEKGMIDKINRRLADLKPATVVIMVDDMERAEPEVVRKLFPVIDRLGEIENCFFVFAIDPERIAKAFEESGSGTEETKGYLDKVFDLRIELPQPHQEDIARMCRSKIEPTETPKLHAAFEELAGLLPANPRLALLFLSDAKNQEFLFLDRYHHEEKPFVPFFIYRLCEVEFSGFGEAVSQPRVRQLYEYARPTAWEIRSKEWILEKDGFGNFVLLLSEALGLRKDDHDKKARLQVLMEGLLRHACKLDVPAKEFDIGWATAGPVTLLKLTEKELADLGLYWKRNAGAMPIKRMLETCFPEYERFESARCAQQFVLNLLGQFEAIVNRYFVLAGLSMKGEPEPDPKLKELVEQTDLLSRHFQFSRTENLSEDLAAFDTEFIRASLLFVRNWLSQRAAGDEAAFGRLLEFHLELFESMPLENLHRWHFQWLYETEQEGNQNDHAESKAKVAKDWLTHLQVLQKAIVERKNGLILNMMSLHTFAECWGKLDLGEIYRYRSFENPNFWIWSPEEEWAGFMRKLHDEASRYLAIAEACALIVSEGIFRNADSGDLLPSAARYHPDYLHGLWRTALQLPEESEKRQALIRRRNSLAAKINARLPEDKALFDQCCPL